MNLQISGQYGEPAADAALWPMQKRLNTLFDRHLVGHYLSNLQKLSIALRVSGKTQDFGNEGPERLKHSKKHEEVTIDLVIPEARWRGVPADLLKTYLTDGIRRGFEKLLDKSRALGELTDEPGLRRDFDRAMNEFHGSAKG
jgi:hypothetical protein